MLSKGYICHISETVKGIKWKLSWQAEGDDVLTKRHYLHPGCRESVSVISQG